MVPRRVVGYMRRSIVCQTIDPKILISAEFDNEIVDGDRGQQFVSREQTKNDHPALRLVVLCACHEHRRKCLHVHAEVVLCHLFDDGLLIQFLHRRQERDNSKLAALRIEYAMGLRPGWWGIILHVDGATVRADPALVIALAIFTVGVHQRFATRALWRLALLRRIQQGSVEVASKKLRETYEFCCAILGIIHVLTKCHRMTVL